MITSLLLIVFGLIILIYGADILIKGAVSLSKKAGIPPIVIGLTIVAFGTSAPELIVNITAALKGSTDIAIGNILGSNIANILLILGAAALIANLKVAKSTIWKEIPFAFLAVLVLFILGNDLIFSGGKSNALGFGDGLIFLSFFTIFMYYIFGLSQNSGEETPSEVAEVKNYSYPIAFALTFGGLIGLFLGGKLFVEGAIDLARIAGLSEMLIGLTIVAIGTSLPELAASIIAAKRGHTDLAVGNVIGSNIFNILWILGVTSLIEPIPLGKDTNIDIFVCLGSSFILFTALFIGRHTLTKLHGIVFLLSYFSYLGYLIFRG